MRKKIGLLILFLLFVGVCLFKKDKIIGYANNSKMNHIFYSNISIPYRYISANMANVSIPRIKISLSKKALQRFDKFGDDVVNGLYIVLPGDSISYVKCKLKTDDYQFKGKLKYTGGYSDHYNSSRRSVRIKLNELYKDMSRFNLYNPACRYGGVSEMLNHKMLKDRGNMILKTDFISLKINDKKREQFFLEEQFSMQVIKNNNRGPGIIFRIEQLDPLIIKYYDRSNMDENYASSLDTLQNALEMYLKGTLVPSQIFDLDKLTNLYTHVDLVGGYHALAMINLRYYYDFNSKMIEPVAREFSTGLFEGFLQHRLTPYLSIENVNPILERVNKDEECRTLYIEKLNKMITPEYLEVVEKKYSGFVDSQFLKLDATDPIYDHELFRLFKNNIEKVISYIPEQFPEEGN